jgi:hypothetical protein
MPRVEDDHAGGQVIGHGAGTPTPLSRQYRAAAPDRWLSFFAVALTNANGRMIWPPVPEIRAIGT